MKPDSLIGWADRFLRGWALFKWHFLDYRGRPCKTCGFSEAAHYDHKLEWDIDNYPCERFIISGKKKP